RIPLPSAGPLLRKSLPRPRPTVATCAGQARKATAAKSRANAHGAESTFATSHARPLPRETDRAFSWTWPHARHPLAQYRSGARSKCAAHDQALFASRAADRASRTASAARFGPRSHRDGRGSAAILSLVHPSPPASHLIFQLRDRISISRLRD